MSKKKSILAWHFLYDTGLMRDGRKPRKIETHDGELALCQSGLHASVKLTDALQYAPGIILCRVRCSGKIVMGEDKLVCSQREILWCVTTDMLHEFARLAALRATRVYAAKACDAKGAVENAKALMAIPDDATPSQTLDIAWNCYRNVRAIPGILESVTWNAAWAASAAELARTELAAANSGRAIWAASDAIRAIVNTAKTTALALETPQDTRKTDTERRYLSEAWDTAIETEHRYQSTLLLRMIRKLPKNLAPLAQ